MAQWEEFDGTPKAGKQSREMLLLGSKYPLRSMGANNKNSTGDLADETPLQFGFDFLFC